MNKPTGTSLTQTVTFYGQILAAQPTVPTVNNATTAYTQNFGADQTSLNYSFFLLLAPTCTSVTTIGGTFPFSVSANVINNCNISATPVAFGSRGLLQSAVTANGTLTAQCTNGDAYRISLNGGSSGNVAARAMRREGAAPASSSVFVRLVGTRPRRLSMATFCPIRRGRPHVLHEAFGREKFRSRIPSKFPSKFSLLSVML